MPRLVVLAAVVCLLASPAHAVPIHPNMISISFGSPTLTSSLPAGASFSMRDATFASVFNAPDGFFGGWAGDVSLDGSQPVFNVGISIPSMQTLWDDAHPELVAVLPFTMNGSFSFDGVNGIYFLPSGGFFFAASSPYILSARHDQRTNWDSHIPLTIDASPVEIAHAPEPSTVLLLGTGLLWIRRRR